MEKRVSSGTDSVRCTSTTTVSKKQKFPLVSREEVATFNYQDTEPAIELQLYWSLSTLHNKEGRREV